MTRNITFSLPAEAMQGAGEAVILGDFNNWNPEHAPKLAKQENGSFSVSVPLEEGETYHYRFLLDNEIWVNDYNAQGYEPAPGLNIDNCVITIPETSVEGATASKKATKKATKVKQEQVDEKPALTKAPQKAASKTTKAEGEKKVKAKAAGDKAPKSVKPKAAKSASPKTEE